MKTKLTMLMAVAGLFTLNASAQEKPAAPPAPGGAPAPGGPGGPGRGRPQPTAEDIKKYDKDADGKLSEEERTAMRADRDKAMLEKYDADKNGKLDEAETKKMRDENPRGRGGPGGAGGPGGRGGFAPTPEDIKKYDKDADGKLNEEETKAMREARQKEMLEKYDADKDGKLDETERQKMMDDFRKARPEGTRPGGRTAPPPSKPEPAKIPVPETK